MRMSSGADGFLRLVQRLAANDPARSPSAAVRALFAIRWRMGALFGWDSPATGLGSRVPTLRDRLPDDLREAPAGPEFVALPFRSLYLLDDEFAAEIANETVHAVVHLGNVRDESGAPRVEMAIYVKPNGLLGSVYLKAIRPFRHWIVYPAMLRAFERE